MILCLASQSTSFEYSEKCHHSWYILLLKLTYLNNYRFDFIKQSLNGKPYSCRWRFVSNTIEIDLCIKILIVQNLQKTFFRTDSFRLSKLCLSVTAGLISYMGVTISNLTFWGNLIQISVSCILHQNPDTPNNWSFHFIDSHRYAILYFSVTRDLSSSCKFSIKILIPLEEDSIEKALILTLASKFW